LLGGKALFIMVELSSWDEGYLSHKVSHSRELILNTGPYQDTYRILAKNVILDRNKKKKEKKKSIFTFQI